MELLTFKITNLSFKLPENMDGRKSVTDQIFNYM